MHKGLPESQKPAGPLPLAKLVDCLQKLGGVGEAQLTFKRHMPTQASHLRAIIKPFPCGGRQPLLIWSRSTSWGHKICGQHPGANLIAWGGYEQAAS